MKNGGCGSHRQFACGASHEHYGNMRSRSSALDGDQRSASLTFPTCVALAERLL